MFDKGSTPIESVQDPKTGETIHRVAISQELVDGVNKTITTHQETMNAFVMNSQNFFMGLKIQLELLDKIKIADEAIKKTLGETQKKAKLDPKKPWAFNLQLKTFEYREPPVAEGLTNEQLEASRSIAVK